MARKEEQKANTNGHDNGGIKVRVIEFELHGRNATVSEGIKAITQAISGRAVVISEPRRPSLPAVPKPGNGAGTVETEELELQAEDVADPEDLTVEPETDVEEETATPSNGGGNATKRAYSFKKPTFLNDLDPSKASKPLKDFIDEKKPSSVPDKYMVVVVWLITYMGIPEVTIVHVYTIFDQLGWKGEMPTNPSIPLRDLKSKKNMLTREEGAEGYKVNFKGEKYVENMGK
jgi:hypothetical protein